MFKTLICIAYITGLGAASAGLIFATIKALDRITSEKGLKVLFAFPVCFALGCIVLRVYELITGE